MAADQDQPASANAEGPTDAGQNVAVAALSGLSLNKVKSLAATKGGEKIIHAKATRHIAGVFGLNLWGLEYLGALVVYIDKEGRHGAGVDELRFIDWTGARSNWKRRMKQGGAECLALGMVDRFPFGTGYCIDISQKGERVIEEYNRRFEEIQRATRAKAEEMEVSEGGKRLKRAAARRAGKMTTGRQKVQKPL